MIIWLCIFICIILILKLLFIKKSLKDIETSLKNILSTDTNNLIVTSSSDKSIKNFVMLLNNELKELRKQKLEFENGNLELKNAITNISHDLRTPLTAISGYIELIQVDELSTNQEKYVEILKRKSDELIELTEQLFNFSKATNINVKLENCCLNDVLEEAILSYYSIFKDRNITPNILICKDKIYKMINKISLVRIFENIISNVLKYSNGDFKVELKNDGTIIFSNKAPSLDTTTVQKIFDRYFTVENAKNSTGLGLSIAKQLVELNGGIINAKYVKGRLIISIKFM